MGRDLGKPADARVAHEGQLHIRPCGVHVLADDGSFSAHDCVCHAGASSPVSEGEYPRVKVAVMLSGSFHARTSSGEVLASPGSLLVGNALSPYEYRHVDDGGDRSLTFEYGEALLQDAGRSLGANLRGEHAFGRICIPASSATAGVVVLAYRALCSGDMGALKEAAFAVAAAALSADRGGKSSVATPSSRQAERVARVLRYVESHSAGDCSLDTLAAHAGLSSFHFLRVFQAMTGQTPRQWVIATRLRAAAIALQSTRGRITDIALETGFGDVSHFNVSFARAFGVSPRRYRQQHGVRAQ
jgi:AraC family transcriptional regulator